MAYLTCISKVMSGLGICQGIYHAPWPLGSRGVCLNVRGSCYLQRPVNGQLESWPQDMRPCQFPRNMPRPWDHDNLGGLGCHQDHGDVLTWNAAGDFSGSPTLLWLGHVLMSVAPVTIEIRAEYSSLGLHLRSCWSLRVKLPPELYKSGWPVLHPRVMVLSGPKLLQGLCQGTWVPLQPESVLKYIVYAATKATQLPGICVGG